MNRILFPTLALAVGLQTSQSPVAPPAQNRVPAQGITWISSTNDQKWQSMPAPVLAPSSSDTPPQVRVSSQRLYQTIDGFGGCFNELGWVALGKASEADRKQVMSALFGNDGAAFNLARIPIGASDFALDGYSLDDTPGDFALRNFSIARDRQNLIPFIKAAQSVRPTLQSWASPWSPPAWMKTNGNYAGGSIKQEPAVLRSYANYFTRWVDAYRGEGIPIYAISPQNEPNILNNYPTCAWSGPQLRDFIADYLGPTLAERKTRVQLWAGFNGDPLNGGDNPNDRLATVLESPKANAFLTGIAFQYDSRNQIALASELYPGKKLMQSETVCFNGDNSWDQAQELFGLMKRYLDGGANAYFAWNMVLNESGLSSWKWRQNALVSVDQNSGKVTYNGEYYVMRHFSQFVKPGARRVSSTGVWGDKIAFVNPDGSTVLVVGNSARQPYEVSFALANRAAFKATLAPQSINTFVLPARK